MWHDSLEKLGVKGVDNRVIEPFLAWLVEDVPWQSVNLPSMVQANVPEVQLDSASRFGERSDEEIGSKRDGCGNSGLPVHCSMLTEDNNFPWCGHHERGCHWR